MIMVEHDRTLPPRSGNSQHQQHQQQQQQQQQLLQGRETGTYEQIEHQSAPTTPSPPYQYAPMQQFAHQHQQHSVRSTPTSYPSPASYPSPSMTAYAYPVPALPQGHNSPNVQAMNASGYSLPPIRMTPPTSSLPPAGMPMGGTPSLTAPPPGAIYYPPPQPYNVPVQPSITASQISQPGRYSHTPGATERIMSGGRHKKEIKRRTKTGCLTCRKRRIKCDEAHPSCKNCAKSKRECLGYDPIFKSQTGPPPILPPVQSGSIPSSAIAIHPNGMAYGHANTAPPPMAVSQPTYAYGPPMSTAENSPASSCEPYEFNVIDPALESTPIPMVQPANTQFGMAGLVHDSSMGPRLELKRGYDHTSFDRTSPLSSADSARLSVTPGVRSGSPSSLMKDTLASNKAKRIKIDDLLGKTEERGGGSPLTPPSAELTSHSLSIADMQYIYRTRYGPVLDALVETRWFQTKGLERVMLNDQFANSFVAVLIRIHNRSGTYIPEDVSVPKFCGDAGLLMESVRILWGTRASCTMAPAFPHDCENDYTDNADLMNRDLAIRRLSIIESLLSPHHITLDNTGFSSSSNTGTGKAGSLRGMDESQTNFWNALERFVSLPFRAENIMSAQKSLEEISHNTMDIRFRELLFRIAEAKFFKFRLDGMGEHYPDQDNATSYNSIFRKAADYVNEAVNIPPESNCTDADLVAQRIAGRALGLWGCPQNSTNLAIF